MRKLFAFRTAKPNVRFSARILKDVKNCDEGGADILMRADEMARFVEGCAERLKFELLEGLNRPYNSFNCLRHRVKYVLEVRALRVTLWSNRAPEEGISELFGHRGDCKGKKS